MDNKTYQKILDQFKNSEIKLAYIDLFCGAGGTSTGVNQTKQAVVIACVNHDKNAIASHAANHPNALHFIEDIRTINLLPIVRLVNDIRKFYPHVKIVLWASLECTNFSKAKGGMARDADSRTLAEHLYRYIEILSPDYIQIENVVEFMAWGPLDENGKPVSRRNGSEWLKWRSHINSFGYYDDWRELNAADFGAYTSRNRLFGIFAKDHLPIAWPTATHSKNPEKAGLFGLGLKKWMPVRDCLDFSNNGKSIFDRENPYVDATLERLYAGLEKFVPDGDDTFLCKYYSGDPQSKCSPVSKPSGTIRTKDTMSVAFIIKYYGTGKNISGIEDPAGTLTTKDRMSIVFIDQQYGKSLPASIENPAATLTTNPKLAVCFVEKWEQSNKTPPCISISETGEPMIIIYESDSEIMKKIKIFMAHNGIVDIKMRMLLIPELLRIQGFGNKYILKGSQRDQKKQIGNAVVPVVPRSWVSSLAKRLTDELQIA